MIFFQPIILASEFVTHVVLIVLIGVMIVESVGRRRDRSTMPALIDDWAFYRLFTITVFGAIWILAEYFDLYSIPYLSPARFLIIIFIVLIAGYHTYRGRAHPTHVSTVWDIILIVPIALFVLFDAWYIFMPTPVAGLLYAFSRILGVMSYYFFIMRYLIVRDKP